MSADWIFKVIVAGNSGVGKSSFVKGRIDHRDWFDISPSHSIGVDFEVFNYTLESKDKCKLILWDLKSRERFLDLYPFYFNGACGVLLCFDVTNQQSFDDLRIWIRYIRSLSIDIPIILIGIKSDLGFDINIEEMEQFVKNFHLDGIFFTSYRIRFKKTVIMKQMAKKIIMRYRIPSEETSSDKEKAAPVSLKRKKNQLINHFNHMRDAIHPNLTEETDKLRAILRRNDIQRETKLTKLTKDELEIFDQFVEFFSECPVCGAKNHKKYLKRFYFSSDPSSNSLRTSLVHLMKFSDEFEEIYYNDILIGVPCCSCFRKIFNKN